MWMWIGCIQHGHISPKFPNFFVCDRASFCALEPPFIIYNLSLHGTLLSILIKVQCSLSIAHHFGDTILSTLYRSATLTEFFGDLGILYMEIFQIALTHNAPAHNNSTSMEEKCAIFLILFQNY